MDIRFSTVLVAQPGTVVFFESQSCIPGECGDNSTEFDVVIGGITLERLSIQNTSLKYAGRFPNFQANISNAPVMIVTQYQTFTLAVFLQFSLSQPKPILSINPNVGQRGTNITIMGRDLVGFGFNVAISQVHLGESNAEIIDISSRTVIRVRARSSSPGNATVSINTTDTFDGVVYNGPYTHLINGWIQLVDGNITDIIPPAAQLGRIIHLCGHNLLGGGTSISTIEFGSIILMHLQSIPANSVPSFPGSQCVEAQLPMTLGRTNNEENITIISDTGAIVQSVNTFTISSIESVIPNRGQTDTIVNIRGRSLLSGLSVIPFVFLSRVRAIVTNWSDVEIIVRAGSIPPSPLPQIIGVPGTIEIRIPNPFINGQFFNVSSENQWQYEESGVDRHCQSKLWPVWNTHQCNRK